MSYEWPSRTRTWEKLLYERQNLSAWATFKIKLNDAWHSVTNWITQEWRIS